MTEAINIQSKTKDEGRKFVAKTYGWMCLALFISALSAVLAATYAPLIHLIWGHGGIGFSVLAISEIVLVFVLSATIRKLPVWGATLCFIAYSILNGLTLSSIFVFYSLHSITSAFLAASLMFGLMSLYGMLTKTNLATAGHYLMMGVIGLVIISAINLLVTAITHTPLPILDWVLSLVTVVLFTGLTAYDTQKIARASLYADESEVYQKLSIYGALNLYIDFINIFLSLLRLFGRRN